jgi:hypothetical protein
VTICSTRAPDASALDETSGVSAPSHVTNETAPFRSEI